MKVLFGIDVLLKDEFKKYLGKSIGLLCNQASVDDKLVPTYIRFKEVFGESFKVIFSPQHGLFSEKQANMIGSEDEVEPFTKVKVISLYGPRLFPEESLLSELEVVFVDIQDTGCRVYTYAWTLFLLMKACVKTRTKVVILDRPNPAGGNIVEGPLLEKEYFSFVGMAEVPLRHGLTLGELGVLFKNFYIPKVDLEVVKLKGYKREFLWKDLERHWVFPSPNIPTWETSLIYSGTVLLEGTNLSEGRGTALPFFLIGAPYLGKNFKNYEKLLNSLEKLKLNRFGLYLRPVCFEPVFDKWKGKRCYGFQVHLLNHKVKVVEPILHFLKLVKDLFEEFEFLPPPYEFEREKLPIEILIGNKKVVSWLKGEEKFDLREYVYYNLKEFAEKAKSCYLYQ